VAGAVQGGRGSRQPYWHKSSMADERIETNPDIMGGKPVIRGTRIPVELVLRKLGAGMPIESIIVDHPRLTPEDIRAAQAFAADYLAEEDNLRLTGRCGYIAQTFQPLSCA